MNLKISDAWPLKNSKLLCQTFEMVSSISGAWPSARALTIGQQYLNYTWGGKVVFEKNSYHIREDSVNLRFEQAPWASRWIMVEGQKSTDKMFTWTKQKNRALEFRCQLSLIISFIVTCNNIIIHIWNEMVSYIQQLKLVIIKMFEIEM